jgi:hypothetical protein
MIPHLASSLIFALLLSFFTEHIPPASAELNVKLVGAKTQSVSAEGTVGLFGDDVPALKNSVATINGNIIEVTVPDPEGSDKTTTLRGAIIKSELSAGAFTGYIAINDNPYLVKVDDPEVEELIEVVGGGIVSGKITEITANGVKIGDQLIPLAAISRICSPTIFQFTCAIASQMNNVVDGFEGRSKEMQLQRTTSLDKSKKNPAAKRCCKFPPLIAPGKGKGKGGGHHIHIIIPI